MKRSQMRLFYKAITTVSLLSIALTCNDVQAVTLGSSTAKQIGFRVANSGAANGAAQNQGIIDQPPVVIQGRSGNAQPQSQSQSQQQPARAPNAYAQQGAPSMAMEPVVEGFGDKVPLTVAIQQILPQGYGYTLGDGVDAGQLVSWRGGRPWTTVLQDMLGQAGLSSSINGRSVAINGNGASPTIVSGTPRPAPQPVIQPVQQAPVVAQQPIMMDPAPVMQPAPQPVMMQPQPQIVMQQPVQMQAQPMMMQPAPQMQPVIMQPQGQQQMVMMQPQPQMVMVDPQGQPMMMQQPVQMAPAQQVAPASTAPQPLQIENPLVFQSQTWEARPGQTLRALLQDWCTRVGVELTWTAEFDYPIMASMNMTGTFRMY